MAGASLPPAGPGGPAPIVGYGAGKVKGYSKTLYAGRVLGETGAKLLKIAVL